MGVTHVLYLSEVTGRSPFSGAENHVLVLVEALAARNVDVELVAMLWAGDDYLVVSARLDAIESAGVRVLRIKRAPARSTAGRWLAMAKCWATLLRLLQVRRTRAVHVHLDLFASVLVTRLAGCRRVLVSIHNDEPAYGMPRWRIWWWVVDRLLVRRYIAITKHVSRYLQRVAGLPADKISVVYYGVVPRPSGPGTRERFSIDPNAFVVGFVGRLSAQKNLVAFVEAMEMLPDVTAVIVGAGELRSELERLIEVKRLKNVRLLGDIPNAEVVMPMFDLFCLPSLWEGLGLVLVEAMLQHVPIIGSNRGAIPEVLGEGQFGVLFEPTPAGIADAISSVRARPDLARLRALAAHEHAADVFTVSRMVNETMAVYAAL